MLMDKVTKWLEFDKAERMIAALEVCQCAETSRDCDTKCPYVAETAEGIACHEKLMQDAAAFIKCHTIGNQEKQPTTRKTILDAAATCVCKERNDQYGEPEDCFQDIANLWAAYKGVDFDPFDVAMMMSLLKVARAKANPQHTDNYVDLCGYGSIAGELANKEENE